MLHEREDKKLCKGARPSESTSSRVSERDARTPPFRSSVLCLFVPFFYDPFLFVPILFVTILFVAFLLVAFVFVHFLFVPIHRVNKIIVRGDKL